LLDAVVDRGFDLSPDTRRITQDFATYITKQSFVELRFDAGGDHTVDASLIDASDSFGFTVTVGGVGSTHVNIGDAGQTFGAANDSEVRIIDLLLAVNDRSSGDLLFDADADGSLDNLEALDRIMAHGVFSMINEIR
jgi:hypothetical protein